MYPVILGTNLTPAGYLVSQNPGIGLTGDAMLAGGYNSAGVKASGLSSSFGGMDSKYGMNSMSPSAMGRYASQTAFNQGWQYSSRWDRLKLV